MYKLCILVVVFGVSIGHVVKNDVVNMYSGDTIPVQQVNSRISDVDEEMSVGECTDLDPDNLIFNQTLLIPSRSRLASAINYQSQFNSRSQEQIYCIKWTPGQDTTVVYAGGPPKNTHVTFTLSAPSGKNAKVNYLVYGN